jgi:hypothetical protein
MLRLVFGSAAALVLLAGCNNMTTSRPTTSKDTHIETPGGDIHIHSEKSETPSGGTEKHIEIKKKDKP